MKYVYKFLALFLALVLQYTAIVKINIFGVSPDLVIVVLIVIAIISTPVEGATLGFLIGAVSDILFGRVFGINTLLCMYTAVGVRALIEAVYGNSAGVFSLFAFVFTFIYKLLFGLMSFVIFSEKVSLLLTIKVIVLCGLYNAVLMIPSYFIIKRFRLTRFERGVRL